MNTVEFRRHDGSFVGTVNGMPFHITPDYPELFAWAQEIGADAPFEPEPEVLPPPTAEQLVEQIRAAVQAHVDTTARARLYDSGNSLASYVASTNAAWAAEAQAFVAWRDAVWAQVYGLWAAPPEPWPTPEAVVAGLPAISWPA